MDPAPPWRWLSTLLSHERATTVPDVDGGDVSELGTERAVRNVVVGPVGLEPTTNGLKVRCSTN
jgi:hypothetical protein